MYVYVFIYTYLTDTLSYLQIYSCVYIHTKVYKYIKKHFPCCLGAHPQDVCMRIFIYTYDIYIYIPTNLFVCIYTYKRICICENTPSLLPRRPSHAYMYRYIHIHEYKYCHICKSICVYVHTKLYTCVNPHLPCCLDAHPNHLLGSCTKN